ncbi:Complement factor B [Acipenser ruthenus]|uniref:Complement factor B n=1 Tax=Acipenser ruthenus TaxID=7906 RepID=A0A444UCQ4_ACIRT|nr:Complement factor B [Acipenser ruthenus]
MGALISQPAEQEKEKDEEGGERECDSGTGEGGKDDREEEITEKPDKTAITAPPSAATAGTASKGMPAMFYMLKQQCYKDALKAPIYKDVPGIDWPDVVTDRFLCTGGTDPVIDDVTCKGDSGGSLFLEKKRRMFQVSTSRNPTTLLTALVLLLLLQLSSNILQRYRTPCNVYKNSVHYLSVSPAVCIAALYLKHIADPFERFNPISLVRNQRGNKFYNIYLTAFVRRKNLSLLQEGA